MQANRQPSVELFNLIEAFCLDQITTDQASRLEEIVRHDRNAVTTFVQFMHMHALAEQFEAANVLGIVDSIVDKTQTEKPQDGVSSPSLVASPLRTQIASQVSPRPLDLLSGTREVGRNASVFATVCVAMLVYGAFGFLVWQMSHFKLTPNHQQDAFLDAAANQPVATILSTTDVQWSAGATPKDDDSPIRIGESLKIESGQIQLNLKQGAELLVEGPAEWSIDGDNRATLKSGKIVARVPSQAIGFAMQTPTATVIDLGTEFGVMVDSSGRNDIHVFEGKVMLKRNVAEGHEQGDSILILQGNTVRLTATGEVIGDAPSDDASAAPTFVRRISRKASSLTRDSSAQGLEHGDQRTRVRLLSLYPFDGATNNVVVGAADGTLEGGIGANNLPSFVPGKIGTRALNFDGIDDRVNTTIYGYPKASLQAHPSSGLWKGSAAFWIKMTASNLGYVSGAQEGNTTFNLVANPDNTPGQWLIAIRTSVLNVFAMTLAAPDNIWRSGDWHHIVITWNITAGAAGTGVGTIWIDGVSKPVNITANGATINDGFDAWADNPMLVGARSKQGSTRGFFTGSLDDVGIWNNQLTEVDIRALYNLGNDSILNYNARDVQILLDVFANVPGAKRRTSDGRTWKYATGLSGNTAEVINNHTTVILDAVKHTGVQVISN